jgi:hypothetical protein
VLLSGKRERGVAAPMVFVSAPSGENLSVEGFQ